MSKFYLDVSNSQESYYFQCLRQDFQRKSHTHTHTSENVSSMVYALPLRLACPKFSLRKSFVWRRGRIHSSYMVFKELTKRTYDIVNIRIQGMPAQKHLRHNKRVWCFFMFSDSRCPTYGGLRATLCLNACLCNWHTHTVHAPNCNKSWSYNFSLSIMCRVL